METLESYVREQWQAGDDPVSTLVNPASGQPIALTSTQGIDEGALLDFARHRGGAGLRAMTFAERGTALMALSRKLHDAREELIEASVVNAGTTRSDAKFDIDGATGTLAYYGRLGQRLGDRTVLLDGEGEQLTRSSRYYGFHIQTPRPGVAVHINAFNFPAWGLAEKAAVAFLAGMPVVTKPATATALTAHRVAKHVVAAGVLPPGAFQFVCGSVGSLLDRLVLHDVLAFTGSSETAAKLRRLEAVIDGSVRLNVEADSLNASVLGADVEPDSETYRMFVRDCAREITQKTGQKCTAVRRIFVPAASVDRVEEDLREVLMAVTVGDPALSEVNMGPLATARQLEDVRAGVQRLRASGARSVSGSATTVDRVGGAEGGFFVAPLLLRADEPGEASAVHEHEVFGPVATLMAYDGVDEVVRWVALGRGGLVTSLYSDDPDVVRSVALGLAPLHGRVFVGSRKIADQAPPPGAVLASCVHGGPGRAGGGEELGGLRGLSFYLQRTVLQGDRALLERVLSAPVGA